MDRYSYDRREGDAAVLVDDNGDSLVVAVSDLPADAREGDRLVKTDADFTVDERNTADVRRRVSELQRRLHQS